MFKISALDPEKHSIGDPFIELQWVDSTNNYAMRQAHEGLAQHGFVVFAHGQTAGKGQRHKQWHAQHGANLMLSAVVQPPPRYTQPAFIFSMAMAVAAHGLLKKFAGDAVKIKWPNDLYIRDRKAGGILIENSLSGGNWKFAVVGMGLNINQTDFGNLQAKAISLKEATGNTYDTIALAKDLCNKIESLLKDLETDPGSITAAYHQQLYKRGEQVKFKKGSRVFKAQVQGVNAAGQLVVQHAVEEGFNVGEVEWLL